MSRPPVGFRVLAVCAGVYGVSAAAVMLGAGNATGRGGPGLLAAVALVAAEALWSGRPWAFRASVALAAGFYLSVLLASTAIGFGPAVFIIVMTAAFIGPALAYVGSRMARLHAAAPRVLP